VPEVCKTMPVVPAELEESYKMPVALKSPTTVRVLPGVVVPMPKFPP